MFKLKQDIKKAGRSARPEKCLTVLVISGILMFKLKQDIKKAGRSARPGKCLTVLLISGILAGILGGIVYWMVSDLPKVHAIEEYVPAESSKVYSADGRVLAEFYYERRTFVPSYQIPDQVKRAFVAIEDVRFYSHPGVDFIGILRTHAGYYKKHGEGGSTITQQLAKMLLKPENPS
jgi:penicillin-binding protein 1A